MLTQEVGDKIAASIFDFVRQPANINMVAQLQESGLLFELDVSSV